MTNAGKKRYSREEKRAIKKERKELLDSYYVDYLKKSNFGKLEKEYDELVSKYGIDGDFRIDTSYIDSDGNYQERDYTKEEEKAIERCYEIWNEQTILERKAEVYASSEMGKDLADKYGQEIVDSINRAEKIKEGAKWVGAGVAFLALPTLYIFV